MKKVLCFGDSNIYGFIPNQFGRYNENERWSGILKQKAINNFEIIEAGCNNRTCFQDNPEGIEQTGYRVLPKYLKNDVDILVLALGINDLQFAYNTSTDDIKFGLEKIIKIAKEINRNVQVLILIPNVIAEDILDSFFASMFDKTSIEKSKELTKIYSQVAKENGCFIVDLNKVVEVSKKDGLHYEKEAHLKIAGTVYDRLLTMGY